MKIKQLDIAGFRSLKNVSWQPGDLNVVIGQNGTGKSNLLRMLELIAASARGQLAKHIQMAGGIDALFWDGRVSTIVFHLQTDDRQTAPNDYKVMLASLGKTGRNLVELETLTHRVLFTDSPEQQAIKYFKSSFDQETKTGEQEGIWEPEEGTSVSETLLSLATASVGGNSQEYAKQVAQFRKRLSEIVIHQGWEVGQKSEIRQATVTRYEKSVEPDGQNLVPVLHTLYTEDREFKRSMDAGLRAAFGFDYEELVFAPAADQRVQLRVRWKTLQRTTSAADLSDGFLRFLLLLTTLTAPDPPMLLAIDEPETGLHPSMLPIIAEFAVEASSRTQVVFTTHSPQFLDAFTDTKPTTTVARWENGETLLTTLEGEELKYWLAEYSLGELFRSGELEAMTP